MAKVDNLIRRQSLSLPNASGSDRGVPDNAAGIRSFRTVSRPDQQQEGTQDRSTPPLPEIRWPPAGKFHGLRPGERETVGNALPNGTSTSVPRGKVPNLHAQLGLSPLPQRCERVHNSLERRVVCVAHLD